MAFEGNIASINIKTGEGFCKIWEFWRQQSLIVNEYEAKPVVPVKPLTRLVLDLTGQPPVPIPEPEEYPTEIKIGIWSDTERKQLKYLLLQGVSDAEIARMLGRHVQGVRRVKKSLIRQEIMGGKNLQSGKRVNCTRYKFDGLV